MCGSDWLHRRPIGPVPVSPSSSCSGAPYRWHAFRSSTNRIALAVQPWGVLLPVLAIAVLTVGTNLIADGVAAASAGGSSVVEEDLEGVRAGAQGAAPAGSAAVPESEAATGSASASAPEAAGGPHPGADSASSPEEGRR